MIRPQYFESYVEYMHAVLKQRNQRNPGYSLRAFARDIEMSPARLSEILSGKGNLGVVKLKSVADSICKNEEDRTYFTHLALSVISPKEDLRASSIDYMKRNALRNEARSLLEDEFEQMSEWYYLAVWNYLLLGRKNTLPEIENEFQSVEKEDLRQCLSLLCRLSLVTLKDQVYVANEKFLSIFLNYSSAAIRKYHKSMLKQADLAIEMQSVDERHLHSRIIPLNKDQYTQLTGKIEEFMRSLSYELGVTSRQENSSIYAINTQCFRLNQSREV